MKNEKVNVFISETLNFGVTSYSILNFMMYSFDKVNNTLGVLGSKSVVSKQTFLYWNDKLSDFNCCDLKMSSVQKVLSEVFMT